MLTTGFGPTLTMMTKLLASWSASLTQMSAGFPASVESPTCVRVNGVVKVFVVFKSLPFSLSFCGLRGKSLYSCWVLAKCSSCSRLHSLFARAKAGR